jgi:hypothetical protein
MANWVQKNVAFVVTIALTSCASTTQKSGRSPAATECDAACRAAQTVAIEAIGYIAKGVYLSQRETLLALKRNPTPAEPYRLRMNSTIALNQFAFPIAEGAALTAFIYGSREDDSGSSTNPRVYNFFNKNMLIPFAVGGGISLSANASTAFSIEVPTEKTKTHIEKTHTSSPLMSGVVTAQNWQFLIRRSAQHEAAAAEASAANAERETLFIAERKAFAGDIAGRIGRIFALSRTEVLTLKRQLETRLESYLDTKKSDVPSAIPLDMKSLLNTSGVDFEARVTSLATVLDAIDGRGDRKIDYPGFYTDVIDRMDKLAAWNVDQSERLWATKDPTDRKLSSDYLKDARMIEVFAKRLATQRDLLKAGN